MTTQDGKSDQTANPDRDLIVSSVGAGFFCLFISAIFFYLSSPAFNVLAVAVAVFSLLIGFGLLLWAISFPFGQFLDRLHRQGKSPTNVDFPNDNTYTRLAKMLLQREADLRVGSWWVFNLALVSLAIGVAISLYQGEHVRFAPFSLIAFSGALLTAFWYMNRRAALLAERACALLAYSEAEQAKIGDLDNESKKFLMNFFDSRHIPSPKPIKAVEAAIRVDPPSSAG